MYMSKGMFDLLALLFSACSFVFDMMADHMDEKSIEELIDEKMDERGVPRKKWFGWIELRLPIGWFGSSSRTTLQPVYGDLSSESCYENAPDFTLSLMKF